MRVSVFAPGKLFVIGEYAVLEGGRALVAAVDAGIVCTLEERRGPSELVAPDLGVALPLDRAGADRRARLLARVAAEARRAYGLSPSRFFVRGSAPASRRKSGLGGSAASVVAILGAAAAAAGEELRSHAVRERLFDLALALHREHQSPRGSGADVAASVWGGWLDYCAGEGRPRMAPAALPPDAGLVAAWSGVAAETAAAIERFAEVAGAAIRARLRAVLDDFWRAVADADRGAIVEAISRYGEALEEIGPRPSPLGSLVRAAAGPGVAAKGSGAVGGDCAIAVGFDAAALAAAAARWRALGASLVDAGVDREGVRRETRAATDA